MSGLALPENSEVLDFVVRFPRVFGVGITFPMNKVNVLARGILKAAVQDSFGDVLTLSFYDNRRWLLLNLTGMTFFKRFKARNMERVVDFHRRR